MKRTLFCSVAMATATPVLADVAGYTALELEMPHFEQTVGATIFYPAADGGTQEMFGGGPTFVRIPVQTGAEVVPGTYPLVLYSHDWHAGLGPQAWITAGIAERGAISAHVDHLYNLWGDHNNSEALNHWSRNQDLQVLLDHILADETFGPMIDTSRIMVVGFGEGGLTALTAGGATANLEGVVAGCQEYGDAMRNCAEIMADEVNLPGYDSETWNASYQIEAVTHVAAIDPTLVYGMTSDNVSDLVGNVALFGFRNGDETEISTDLAANGLEAALPGATLINFEPAYRFSAALDCQEGVEERLAEQGRTPVCTDPEGSDRNVIHAQILDALAQQLGIE